MKALLFSFFDDSALINVLNNNQCVINSVGAIVENFVPSVWDQVDERIRKARNENYYQNTILNFPSNEFENHFRMKRPTIELLISEVGKRSHLNRDPHVSLEKKVLFTIWLLANSEPFRICSQRFGISKGTGHYIFKETVSILNEMKDDFIEWPSSDQCIENAQILKERSQGIDNVIGAIDSLHIFIKKPEQKADEYFNRYQSHSVILQAVCDPSKKFINISIGHPGQLQNEEVFRRSLLYREIINAEDPLIVSPYHIIGDCGFPLLEELLTPLQDTGLLNLREIRYNFRLNSIIKTTVKKAFIMLKGKWTRLKYLDFSDLQLINNILSGCCVLHNIILINEKEDLIEDEEEKDSENDIDINISESERRGHIQGKRKRNMIVDALL